MISNWWKCGSSARAPIFSCRATRPASTGPVGERGSLLSGGQRSLLVLARALVPPSKLLFLDEPTGAMDTQTELYFIEKLKLRALANDQSLVVSTHRHNMLGICDRLIVIDAGKIIADGPRDQVLGRLTSAAAAKEAFEMRVLRNLLPTRRHAAFAMIALLGGVLGGTTLRVQPTQATSATTLIAPADAAALLDATSGEHLVQALAVGDEAKLINASMPFSSLPVTAARPFDLSGSDPLDHRRALLCLTQAVYYEAGFEPLEGRRAVAQVVLNRMRHPAFPTIGLRGGLSGRTRTGLPVQFRLRRFSLSQAGTRCLEAGRGGCPGGARWLAEKSVGAATHYHANYVAPFWAPRLAKITQIGAHIFYRWPGAWGSTAAFSGRYIGEPADPLSLRPPLRRAVLTDGTTVSGSMTRAWPGRQSARAQRRRRFARSVQGLDAQYSHAVRRGQGNQGDRRSSKAQEAPAEETPVVTGQLAACRTTGSIIHGHPSFLPTGTQRRREPLTGARLIIVSVTVGSAIFLLWAMLAQVDEVTAGQGKVIPSSKVQLIQSTQAATSSAELMVRLRSAGEKGQLLARLDSPESRSIVAGTEALRWPVRRACSPEGTGSALSLGGEEATLSGHCSVRGRRCRVGSRRFALRRRSSGARRRWLRRPAATGSTRRREALHRLRIM